MNTSALGIILHAVVGLAVVGALSALGALSVITGDQALTGIMAIVGLLLGSGAVLLGGASTPTVVTPTVLTAAPPAPVRTLPPTAPTV